MNNPLRKICVSPPYFAFKKIYRYENILIAPVVPEQPLEDEIGKIAITEAGRHLAILGSCLFAMDEQEKFYYLACKAVMKSFPAPNFCDKNNKIFLLVRNVSNLKDKFAVYGVILDGDQVIYDLYVEYKKMSPKVFKRLFNNFKLDYKTQIDSPYKRFFAKFENLKIDQNSLSATIPSIGSENCSGHFEEYPMMPVAISAYIISKAAGLLYKKIKSKNQYKITGLDLSVFGAISPCLEWQIIANYNQLGNYFECFLGSSPEQQEVMIKLKISNE